MAAGALPKWVMLERFVFRRDDPASFRSDARTAAASATSSGAPFRVSFLLADPPTPSRLYLSWPDGPSDDQVCHLVAAHRGLVLLRLDYLVDESKPFGEAVHDYFVYTAGPSSQIPFPPLLRRLPHCTEHNSFLEMQVARAFPPLAVGLLCRGEGEFAVASLAVVRSHVTSEIQAELYVLRSSSPRGDDDAKWETKLLPIQHQDDEYLDFLYWVTNAVVPLEDALCWVDYSRGILLCDGIFGEGDSPNPRVSYIRFPQDSFVRVDHARARKGLYRSLSVTECGRRLVFADVARHDGTGFGPMAPSTGFTMTFRTLKVTTKDVGSGSSVQWEWVEDAVVTSGQLWEANTPARLPRDTVMLPFMSVDVPDVVHLVLFDWVARRVSLVAIDLSDKQVMGPVVTYIKGKDDRLSSDDADLVKAKPSFFVHFLPSEFPKFLNLNRYQQHGSPESALYILNNTWGYQENPR